MVAPTIRGEAVTLRQLERGDLEALIEIVSAPPVARWWRSHDSTSMERWLAADDVTWWTIEIEGRVAGKVQAWEESDPEYRHAGIDLFLAPEHHGRGLGAQTVRLVATWLFEERGHHRVTIDPALANMVAIRCYESVGFRRVGVLRRYWYDHVEGDWADGCLLDLLPNELRSAADG